MSIAMAFTFSGAPAMDMPMPGADRDAILKACGIKSKEHTPCLWTP